MKGVKVICLYNPINRGSKYFSGHIFLIDQEIITHYAWLRRTVIIPTGRHFSPFRSESTENSSKANCKTKGRRGIYEIPGSVPGQHLLKEG